MKKTLNWVSQNLLHHSSWGAYFEPLIQVFKPAWREGYYRATVVAIEELMENTIALTLAVEKSWPIHQAGQHIELTLQLNGRLITRVFTIASSPQQAKTKQNIRLVIKQQRNGQLTPSLHELAVGHWVNISSPKGEFVVEHLAKKSLCLAAGSGITPFIAMVEALKARHSNQSQVHLLYYAKKGEHLLVDELSALAKDIPNFSFELMTRQTHGDVGEQLANFAHTALYVCGPNAFYQSVADFAKETGSELYSEHFSLIAFAPSEQATFDLSYNGKTLAISNSSTLLPQLLDLGERVTYGCKMGICHQCQCTKKSGVVKNVLTGKLSDRGEELIQLCVSQVMTDVELKI
ncbi:flavin reductase family protein [Thalassotalea aquiviva]|uniref:flavin reductase family protein n=1 Tax=Thalassotalea aquiviva TaxID=3242415 RepID=UPI00352AB243